VNFSVDFLGLLLRLGRNHGLTPDTPHHKAPISRHRQEIPGRF